MARRKVGGYIWNDRLSRGIRANSAARRIVGQILDEGPGQMRLALMLARISGHLAETLEALTDMRDISAREARNDEDM